MNFLLTRMPERCLKPQSVLHVADHLVTLSSAYLKQDVPLVTGTTTNNPTDFQTLSQWRWDMATLETLWSRLLAGSYLWGSCLGAGGGGWGPPWPSVWELPLNQMSPRTCHSYTSMSQVRIIFLIIVFTFLSSREFCCRNLNFDIRAKIWVR